MKLYIDYNHKYVKNKENQKTKYHPRFFLDGQKYPKMLTVVVFGRRHYGNLKILLSNSNFHIFVNTENV